MKWSVSRTVHVDMKKATREAKDYAIAEALDLGVKRARIHVAKDTGSLMRSIQKLNKYSFGVIGARLIARNKRDYSAYQEGEKPTHTKFTPYLAPAAEDIGRAMAGIIKKALKKAGL